MLPPPQRALLLLADTPNAWGDYLPAKGSRCGCSSASNLVRAIPQANSLEDKARSSEMPRTYGGGSALPHATSCRPPSPGYHPAN